MATNLKYAALLKNAQLDAITTQLGASALLKIYDGTQPTNPDTALGSQNLIVSLTCNATFAPAASGGVLTLNSITNGTAGYSSTATWFSLQTSGATRKIEGSVSTSSADLNLNNVSVNSGQTVSVSSFTISSGN